VKLDTQRGAQVAALAVRARAVRRGRALRAIALAAFAFGGLALGSALALGGTDALARSLARWLTAGRDYARARTTPVEIESLRIDLKFKHLHRLHAKRDEALASGALVALEQDFVPASVSLGDASVPISLRLIGPGLEHVRDAVWSLEIEVGSDAHIQGMRHFAVLGLRAGGGVVPLVAAAHFEKLGLPAPRTSIVELALNGDELGQALLVELPSSELLRARGRRAAPIVALDPAPYWTALASNGRAGPFDNVHTASVVVASAPPDSRSEQEIAVGLLRAFLDERLPASSVFALDETARWLAAEEVWAAEDALHWSRASFALDALSARLVPLPALPLAQGALGDARLVAARSALGAALLADPEIRARFARELAAIAGDFAPPDVEVASLLERRQAWALARAHRGDPFLERAPLRDVAARAAALRDVAPDRAVWFAPSIASGAFRPPNVVVADAGNDADGPYLELANSLPVPVFVETLRHDADGALGAPIALASRTSFPIALPPTPFGAAPERVRIRYRQPNAAAVSDAIRGIARVAGDESEFTFLAQRSRLRLDANPVPTATLEQALAQHPFLRREPDSLALRAHVGSFEVRGSLVLPEGIPLAIDAGTELVFEPDAALVASAALDMRGSASAPVVLRGRDDRRDGRWQGVVLLGSPQPSRWTNVSIRGASGIERPGWEIEAGVAVRRARLELDGVTIAGSDARASLLVDTGRLDARGLEVVDSAGSAIELRASTAELRELEIRNALANGVDASDSRVRIERGDVANIRGAAVVAGDVSQVDARSLEIDTVGIGGSAKNGGRLRLSDSRIRSAANAAFVAYADRPELGGGEIEADRCAVEVADPTRAAAIVERGSRAAIDGVEAPAVAARIGELEID